MTVDLAEVMAPAVTSAAIHATVTVLRRLTVPSDRPVCKPTPIAGVVIAEDQTAFCSAGVKRLRKADVDIVVGFGVGGGVQLEGAMPLAVVTAAAIEGASIVRFTPVLSVMV
jgi:hypothetical protein